MATLEVGKSYRTQDGQTVTIIENVGGHKPWRGEYSPKDGGGQAYWTDHGHWLTYERTVFDLVAPTSQPEQMH